MLWKTNFDWTNLPSKQVGLTFLWKSRHMVSYCKCCRRLAWDETFNKYVLSNSHDISVYLDPMTHTGTCTVVPVLKDYNFCSHDVSLTEVHKFYFVQKKSALSKEIDLKQPISLFQNVDNQTNQTNIILI